jgi:hypothetical protein
MPALTNAEVEQFLAKGYVTIREAFPREVAAEWAQGCYERLGYDPEDRSTWEMERIHMGGSRSVKVREFAPRVFEAMCELLGGEDRIAGDPSWSDHFIANFSERADQPWLPAGPNTPGWHKDGDFFRHYLDSPEQGLLVFVNWTDVVHQGGPTYVATDSVPVVARFLADHPEGLDPYDFDFRDLVAQCSEFMEATGNAGDVTLLHPFTLHAGSQNMLRVPRIITNPPVSLQEPMQFDRADGDFSAVERGVLRGLGVDSYAFRATGERKRLVPERVHAQAKLMAEEAARSEAART